MKTELEHLIEQLQQLHLTAKTQPDCPVPIQALLLNAEQVLQELCKHQRKLQMQEENLQIAAVAFEAKDSIMVTDDQKKILRVNQAFTRITGYQSEEAIGKTPHFLRSDRHDDAFYEQLWATVAANGYWQGEAWYMRKNGEVYPGWQTITAVNDNIGKVTHHIGYLTDITIQKQAETVLVNARYRLENQMVKTLAELDQVKQETVEINTALNVLLKQRSTGETDSKTTLATELSNTIFPFLNRLKKADFGRRQSTHLLNTIEQNLQQLLHSFKTSPNKPISFQQFTPIEAQVAMMVRQGLPTKVIATTLNCAPGTISIHRKNIRKKLGLNNKNLNLNQYLQSLTD